MTDDVSRMLGELAAGQQATRRLVQRVVDKVEDTHERVVRMEVVNEQQDKAITSMKDSIGLIKTERREDTKANEREDRADDRIGKKAWYAVIAAVFLSVLSFAINFLKGSQGE